VTAAGDEDGGPAARESAAVHASVAALEFAAGGLPSAGSSAYFLANFLNSKYPDVVLLHHAGVLLLPVPETRTTTTTTTTTKARRTTVEASMVTILGEIVVALVANRTES